VPGNREEKVYDLLSEGIINADGSPGKNFARAHQFQIISPPSGGKYFISADKQQKALYNVLPAPDLNGVQNPSAVAILKLPGGDPGLPPQEQFLFGTGGTGLPNTVGPDTRITNVNTLPPARSR
jgi:phospholipase C